MQCSIFFVEIGECFMVLGQCIEDVKENIDRLLVVSHECLEAEVDLPSEEIWLVLCGKAKEYQLRQNNWRRMHGLPMRRRICKR